MSRSRAGRWTPSTGSTGGPLEAPAWRELVCQTAASSLRRRRNVARLMVVVCAGTLVLGLFPLAAIVGYTVERGVGAWSLSFFVSPPTPEGVSGGGILYAIVGSLVIDGLAALAAVPLGVAAAIWLASSSSRFADVLRFATDVLAGIPSIIVGILAYSVVVVTMHTFSALAASFALAVLMLPVVARAGEQAIRGTPEPTRAAALSLGSSRVGLLRRVVLPHALPGLVTAALLATAQAAAEAAPLLFTSIGSQRLVASPLEPMTSLPLLIYLDGIQGYPDVQQTAWGAALVLLLLVLLLSVGARVGVRLLRRRRRGQRPPAGAGPARAGARGHALRTGRRASRRAGAR